MTAVERFALRGPDTLGVIFARSCLGRVAIRFGPGAGRPGHQSRPPGLYRPGAPDARQRVRHRGGGRGRLADAVRIGVFLANLDDFPKMDAVYREYFEDPMPARTTVGVGIRGYDIEIDAVIALRGDR